MERVVRKKELVKLLGVSISTLDRWIREGRFPQPIRLGERVRVWLWSDIETFLHAKKGNQ